MHKYILFFAAVIFFAAVPSWAQQQTCKPESIAATTDHLVGKTDGTVADSKNKLMWKRCPEGFNYNSACSKSGTIAYSWTNALSVPSVANNAKFAGYSDWRLPNIKELHSIVEEQCFNPAVKLAVFPYAAGVLSIWSNSPAASSIAANMTWSIELMHGDMLYSSRSEELGVLLVRDCGTGECD